MSRKTKFPAGAQVELVQAIPFFAECHPERNYWCTGETRRIPRGALLTVLRVDATNRLCRATDNGQQFFGWVNTDRIQTPEI